MKNSFKLPITILYLIVLVSCSTDPPEVRLEIPQAKPPVPDEIQDDPEENDDDDSGENDDDDPEENNNGDATGLNFGFFDSGTSSAIYIDMPIESSSTNLFVGRWKIIKIGVDEDDNGDLEYSYNYEDYANKDCGLSFLQFNNDGVIFENSYYIYNNACALNSQIDRWELIGTNRFKISIYDFIFLVQVNESELVLKYNWSYTHWAPMQVYYYYERILPSE